MYFEANATLYILSALAGAIFVVGICANLFLIWKGKAPSFQGKFSGADAIKAVFLRICLQEQIFRQNKTRWFMHLSIFYGFLGLLFHTIILAFMSHFVSQESGLAHYVYQGRGKLWLDLWGDFWGTILLVGLIIACLRRYVFKVEQLDTISTDTTVLFLLLTVVLTGFLSEGMRLAGSPLSADMAYSFSGAIFSLPLRGLGVSSGYKLALWCHILISLIFIAYIPFSKLWHIFATPVEILFDASYKPLGKVSYD